MRRITEFSPAGRYLYDFGACTSQRGWAQFDSEQDASYYGNWINPAKRMWFSYCEGDTTLVICDNDTEFVSYVRESVEWYIKRGEKQPAIDGMCNEQIIAEFQRLGLSDLLH